MGSNLLSLPNSSSTSRWKYDVFLSFRGDDTRYKFTDHLYTALKERGIETFRDDENLERGKIISPELLQAIEESRFAIVILSENYAGSSWCLDELAKIIECEKEQRMTVLPVFHYVDPTDVRKQTGTFEAAFDAHEKRFEEKRVKTWRDALIHVGNLAGCHLKNISPETQDIQRIVRQISRTVRYKFSELTKDLVGIYSQARELESLLALDQFDDVQFIGVWAMGGMGKTTLAQFVYDKVLEEFEDSCFISDVGRVIEKYGLRELQKRLILKLLNESNLDCGDDHDLPIKIMTRLRHKRILLVFDGVDGLNQLKMLAGEHDWFGWGSRIIITTRDKHLLETHLVDKTFEVKPMGYEDARHLFCLKAFNRKHIPDEFLDLSKEFLNYVDGLPLALEVLGFFLFGKSTVEWKSALERLKGDPVGDVIKVLKISFDGLGHSEKEIFLHIACLFNHEEKDYVVEILRSLDLYPEIGLRELIDKSLLKILDNNELWMHNLLGEMGRNIVRQESPEPGKRSRLWLYEDIDHVLKNNEGTEAVQAIDIWGAQKIGICHEEKEECWRPRGSALLDRLQGGVLSALSWRGFKSSKKEKGPLWNPDAFVKMPNLKFLRVQNIYLECVPKHLPHNLRFIEWSDYPSKLLPCFQPDKLVQLHLQRSKIEILWKGMKDSDKLQFINLADSSNLKISPDFTGVPNLKKLVLAGCSNLHKLHPSIGNLKKLILLDLKQCEELSHLVDFTGAPNLEKLVLAGCSILRQLHPSIGNLKKLISLDLKHCKELSRLPDKFEMESLETLELSHCSKVKRIPEFVGNMRCVRQLSLECTAITKLPSSVECLTGLNRLNLRGCKNLQCLPNTICSLTLLKYLDLRGCSKFVNLPENLGNLKGLEELYLEGIAIEELPSSIGCLTALMSLNLRDCKNLVGLPSTICSLERVRLLFLSGCSKIENLPKNLGNMVSLSALYLRGTAIRELPSSTILLKRLHGACFRGCQWPSSSSALMPTCQDLVGVLLRSLSCLLIKDLDFSDCNLSAIPNDIGCLSFLNALRLSGNDFISLPESISRLFRLRLLDLDGCKRLRSLPNLPSKVDYISLTNCISLETLPNLPPDCFYVNCLNCFNLVDNFQSGCNTPQGQSGKLPWNFIIPGSEILTWVKEVNICEEPGSVVTSQSFRRCLYYPPNMSRIFKTKEVNVQVPFDTCDELIRIVLCVVFVPSKHHQYPFQIECHFQSNGLLLRGGDQSHLDIKEKYGKLESHHLWFVHLCNVPSNMRTPCISIDGKGFYEVGIKIATQSLEVEKIGVHFVYKQDIEDPNQTMAQDSSNSSGERGENYYLYETPCYYNWLL